MEIEPTDPVGIALIVIGAFVAFRVAKLVIKLLMVGVILVGLYVWLAM